jgi:hypothetical protein
MGEKIKILLNKLFNYNFVIFNLIILLVFIPFVAYDLYENFLFLREYPYPDGKYLNHLGGPNESLVVIYLITFWLFNVIRFNRLGKKLPIYLIITTIPFLMVLVTKFVGSCLRCRTDNMIFTATCIFLPISFSSYFIIKKEIHILLKILLIFILSAIIYFAGSLIGILTGYYSFGP